MSYQDANTAPGPGTPGPGAAWEEIRSLGGQAFTSSSQLTTLPGKLMAWSILESSGSAACSITLFDGTGNSAQTIDFLTAASGTSNSHTFFDKGIDVERGIWVNVNLGQAKVVVQFQPRVQGPTP